jgi:hypothetical protein
MSQQASSHVEVSLISQLRPRPAVLAAAGFAAATVTVIAGGRVGPVLGSATLTRWFGLLSGSPARVDGRLLPGLLQALGIGALVIVWLLTLGAIRTGRWREDVVWRLAAWWAVPFVLGPPLLSSDVYSYAAQGELLARGLDPYAAGPAALGGSDVVNAVDPVWRNAPSPYGPLTGLIQHASVALGGSPVGAVIALRIVAMLSVVVIGLCAATLATDSMRTTALGLTVLNPLVLLQVVSAAHLEGAMCALLMAALVAYRRSPALALVAACAAAAIKAPAAAAILLIIAQQWRMARSWTVRSPKWTYWLQPVAVVTGCWLTFSLLVAHSWGWLAALATPTVGYTRGSPTALLGDLLSAIVSWAPSPDTIAAARAVGLVAAACIVCYLAATSDRRQLGRSIGYALLAVAALGPVIYPWYLLWGLVCLAPTAASRFERRLVITMSAFGCFMGLTGLNHVGVIISEALLFAAAVTVATRWWGAALLRARSGRRLAEAPDRSLARPDLNQVPDHAATRRPSSVVILDLHPQGDHKSKVTTAHPDHPAGRPR